MFEKSLFYTLPYTVRRKLYSVLKPKMFEKMQHMRTIDTANEYSYKPFDQHECIFVHIPKAAGVSICRALFGNLAGSHTKMVGYQIIFSKEEFSRYFKFTFVRNPWDRVFSAYNFLKMGGMNEEDSKWAEVEMTPYDNFDEFVSRGLQKSRIQKWRHFVPQSDFLFVPYDRRIQVDFLGYFENIQPDFEYIVDKLGMGGEVTLAHQNKSHNDRKLDYKEFYTDETREIVSTIYQKDIDVFGYKFDNSSLQSQLTHRPQLLAGKRSF